MEAIDSDDEMLSATQMEEEPVVSVTDNHENLMALYCLVSFLRPECRVTARRLEAKAPLEQAEAEVVIHRCFRMSQKSFLKIVYTIRDFDSYYICKKDNTGTVGFSSLQKCSASLKMLAYRALGDARDNYMRIVTFLD
jgi:hypothetical protein